MRMKDCFFHIISSLEFKDIIDRLYLQNVYTVGTLSVKIRSIYEPYTSNIELPNSSIFDCFLADLEITKKFDPYRHPEVDLISHIFFKFRCLSFRPIPLIINPIFRQLIGKFGFLETSTSHKIYRYGNPFGTEFFYFFKKGILCARVSYTFYSRWNSLQSIYIISSHTICCIVRGRRRVE